jgi:hypothetical protein
MDAIDAEAIQALEDGGCELEPWLEMGRDAANVLVEKFSTPHEDSSRIDTHFRA